MNKFKEVVRKGYRTYQGIKARCENPNGNRSAHYHDKGISLKIDQSDFMFWFVNEYNKKGYSISEASRIHCGRIDHDKDYTLDNICLQTLEENSLESISRSRFYENNKRAVICTVKEDGYKRISWHPSMRKAMEYHGFKDTTAVSRCCRGLQANFRGKFYFRYA